MWPLLTSRSSLRRRLPELPPRRAISPAGCSSQSGQLPDVVAARRPLKASATPIGSGGGVHVQ